MLIDKQTIIAFYRPNLNTNNVIYGVCIQKPNYT